MDDWSNLGADSFSDELVEVIESELQPDEKLVWISRADRAGWFDATWLLPTRLPPHNSFLSLVNLRS